MRALLLVTLAILSFAQPWLKFQIAQVAHTPTGVYIGYEAIDYPPEKSGAKWYHKNIAYLRGDSIIISTYPLLIRPDGSKAYSASDSGFFTYKGRLINRNNGFTARLLQVSCDYCIMPAVADSNFIKKTYAITPAPLGFVMNGVRYRRTAIKKPEQISVGWPSSKFFLNKW